MISENLIQDVYSTSEVKTNKILLGKPVYRKCFILNPITSLNTDIFFATSLPLSEIDNIWIAGGYYKISVGILPVSFHNYSQSNYSIFTYLNTQQSNIRISIKSACATTGGIIFVEYTKTTD